jgi:hypothetical protein
VPEPGISAPSVKEEGYVLEESCRAMSMFESVHMKMNEEKNSVNWPVYIARQVSDRFEVVLLRSF